MMGLWGVGVLVGGYSGVWYGRGDVVPCGHTCNHNLSQQYQS